MDLLEETNSMPTCPDCVIPINEVYRTGFNVEQCTDCDQQTIACQCGLRQSTCISKALPKPIFGHSIGLSSLEVEHWKSWLCEAEQRLRAVVADVPKKLKRLGLNYWFPGECFSRAVYFVKSNPILASAEYILGESRIGLIGQHGWVEFEDLVFEPVLQEWYWKDGYYALEYSNPWYRFSRRATVYLTRRMAKLPVSTYRWDHWLMLPFGENTPISSEQAKAALAKADAQRKTVL